MKIRRASARLNVTGPSTPSTPAKSAAAKLRRPPPPNLDQAGRALVRECQVLLLRASDPLRLRASHRAPTFRQRLAKMSATGCHAIFSTLRSMWFVKRLLLKHSDAGRRLGRRGRTNTRLRHQPRDGVWIRSDHNVCRTWENAAPASNPTHRIPRPGTINHGLP
ncbi:hypothetical protein DAEQUDRAFT_335817 [Daedalea quercina L-15889]|uniref:Uncharacterized protein n=1 Tax=Daedalea quercina L-15889 TaxID=1314783 RepID=A0A165PHZ0_9APHY|nr:hypothetical protein DAEQUDRAFT_335817 [Daedalea quercina L-15889]